MKNRGVREDEQTPGKENFLYPGEEEAENLGQKTPENTDLNNCGVGEDEQTPGKGNLLYLDEEWSKE